MDINWSMLQTIGIVAIGIGYIYSQFKKGGYQNAAEVIALLQVKDTEQKEIIQNFQNKFEALNKELGELKGILNEKDKQLEMMKSILQNRNPELDAFIKNVGQTAARSNKWMIETTKLLQEIHTAQTQK